MEINPKNNTYSIIITRISLYYLETWVTPNKIYQNVGTFLQVFNNNLNTKIIVDSTYLVQHENDQYTHDTGFKR